MFDYMHLQLLDGSICGDQGLNQMDLDTSAELLGSMNSERSYQECSFSHSVANCQAFEQGLPSEQPSDIHNLLSGYSLY